jgi:uncharacterized protein with PQ loop repeat
MAFFCTIYYICSYIQTIPQLVKLIKTKSSNDYSLKQVLIGFIGLVCWSVYIFTSKQSTLVYIGTVLDFLLLVLVDALILKFYKWDKGTPSENLEKIK